MRVLMIGVAHHRDAFGGMNRYATDLADQLVGRGHRVVLLVRDDRGRLPAREDIGGVAVRRFSARGAVSLQLAAWHAVDRVLAEESFDLINSHFAYHAATARLSRAARALPWVTTFHGPWAHESRVEDPRTPAAILAAKAWIEGRVYRASDVCYSLSEAFRGVLAERYDVQHDRIRVILGGVNTAKFQLAGDRAACRRELGLPLDRPIWLSVRRLARRMGLGHLLMAFSRLKAAGFPGELVIVGDGKCRSELVDLTRDLELGEQVRFAGEVPDDRLPTYYGAADLQIIPTQSLEGFGLTAIECLATGTPVLATPIGGLEEVLGGLSKACLTDGTGTDALLAAMQEILAGPRILPSAQDCRDYVERSFGWPTIVARVEHIFQEALDVRD